MDGKTKEVNFNSYCYSCKYVNTKEEDDPCDECLSHPSNEYSHKPVCWKPMITEEITYKLKSK